jgi:hypothetical protein
MRKRILDFHFLTEFEICLRGSGLNFDSLLRLFILVPQDRLETELITDWAATVSLSACAAPVA